MEVMPLLEAAADAGEDARVVSVLSSGDGGKIDTQDLGLKKTYSLARSASMAITGNDLMVEVSPCPDDRYCASTNRIA